MIKQESNRHIIQKQNIEIDFENISEGFGLQNYIAELFYEKLLPQIEQLFDEFGDEQHLITFETLHIDCGILSHQRWEEEWVTETVRGLRRELFATTKIKKGKASNAAKLVDDFLFFLQTGRLPWNSFIASINEFELIEKDPTFLKKIKAVIQEEKKAADRLVYSFSEAFVNKIITLLIEEKKANSTTNLALEEKVIPVHQKLFQSNLIKRLCSESNDMEESFEENGKTIWKKDHKENKYNTAQPESIYVHNAGLILLHPFLEELFKTLDLRTDQHWNSDLSPHPAALVLEYLVSGSDECPEFNLPLNKIICGLDINEVVILTAPLSLEIKKECDDMLRVVIQHWSALKNTGIEAFREAFLQRNGKLTKVDNGWLLQVEQKPVDVLLGRLPWGIGVIKLPFMHEILYVDWT